ncbi:MAG: hypothetical protein MHMPM18_003410 [Marteilia pararefringens]
MIASEFSVQKPQSKSSSSSSSYLFSASSLLDLEQTLRTSPNKQSNAAECPNRTNELFELYRDLDGDSQCDSTGKPKLIIDEEEVIKEISLKQIESLISKNIELEKSVQYLDSQVSKQKINLEEKNWEIEAYQNTLKNYSNIIANLTNENSLSEKNKKLELLINEKDLHISDLKNEIDDLKKELSELNQNHQGNNNVGDVCENLIFNIHTKNIKNVTPANLKSNESKIHANVLLKDYLLNIVSKYCNGEFEFEEALEFLS